MRISFCIILILLVSQFGLAQDALLPLYEGEPPNALPNDLIETRDTSNTVRIGKVINPSIEVYLPAQTYATGQAVIICPGGGYRILAYTHEGTDVAKMLNGHGIAGIVLKYRLPEDASNKEPHKTPLMDAQQAIRLVRKHAEKWNIDPTQVGILGFSAGGHLAATAATHFDSTSRPSFAALIYPVISMQDSLTHRGSRRNLLGESPSSELIHYYSNELQVSADTPPTFLVHSSDDRAVDVGNSLAMYQALQQQGITSSMHIYPYGGHGYGLAVDKELLSSWPLELVEWIKWLN
ncbi:alpha/beta hydrolase [Marinoscillum furvescens]|uniref:Acetyl esterase/lipase n=1 Tax=Marinoscillum furvescens DSM 4134 TaxID=1122208 RepID=A0A3D9L2J1_MARFU|nr:alpha/beta hydrolase [Marinoscillum furvescens]RED96655.1 acetyl esterase/lipase [Marinoscillum furvescens DSM 4134]